MLSFYGSVSYGKQTIWFDSNHNALKVYKINKKIKSLFCNKNSMNFFKWSNVYWHW